MAEIVDFGLQKHKIKMDSRYFENILSVVAGDTGRRIEVQLLDTNGTVQDTTGLNLRLNALIAGKATYTDATLADAATGKYQLDLSNGMFLAPGNWEFQWQITDATGKKLHSFVFTGNVGSNISEGGSQATNFYLNLEDLKQMQDDLVNGTFNSEALETNIAGKLEALEETYAPRLTEVNAQLVETKSTSFKNVQKISGKNRLKALEKFDDGLFNFDKTQGIIVQTNPSGEKELTIDLNVTNAHTNVAVFNAIKNCESFEITYDYQGDLSPVIRLGFANSKKDFYFLNITSTTSTTDGYLVAGGVLQSPTFTSGNTPLSPEKGDRIRVVKHGMHTQVYLNDVFVDTFLNIGEGKTGLFLPDEKTNFPAIAFRDGNQHNRYQARNLKAYQKRFDKVMHLSIDDVIRSLKELTQNAPASIFDIEPFSFYKKMHDEYGAVFTLNLFYYDWTGGDFSLIDVTNAYKNEFRENSDWLKFAFHANTSTDDYNSLTAATAKSHYDSMMAQIIRFSSVQNIDTVPRLSMFKGSLAVVKALRDTSYGVVGLYSADDDRSTNLYLNPNEIESLKYCDNYVDLKNGIEIFKTDLRLDSLENPYDVLTSRKNDPNFRGQQDLQSIFWHESATLSNDYKRKIEEVCQYAMDNGYYFEYPMNLTAQYY